MKRIPRAALGVCALIAMNVANAAEPFAYPPEGRTEAEQRQDRYECHEWAVAQSGFDPSSSSAPATPDRSEVPPPSATAPAKDGRALAGGALTGAAIGELANGDAADGAVAGGALGAIRNRMARRESADQNAAARAQAQQQAQLQKDAQAEKIRAGQEAYQSARSTCLRARDYTLSDA